MATKTKRKTKTGSTFGSDLPSPDEQGLTLTEGENVFLSEETTVYCIDVSGSMADRLNGNYGGFASDDDEGPAIRPEFSKAAAVRYALRHMLEARKTYANADKLGIVTFGASGRRFAETIVAPGPMGPKHYDALPQIRAAGGTPMYQGLERAAKDLAEAEGLCRIVLMSDGEPNEGHYKEEIVELSEKLHTDYGFVVDVLGIGIPGKTSSYDEDFLKKVALKGGGEFYPVEDVDSLIKRLLHMMNERKMLVGSGIKMLGAVN